MQPDAEVPQKHLSPTTDGADWDDIADWWRAEVADDPVYRHTIIPMYERLLANVVGPVMDLGCGEGQTMPVGGSGTIGVDSSSALLRHARGKGPVVRAAAPELGCFRDAVFGAVGSIYLVDLLEDVGRFFGEIARVVRPAGVLVVVINHPVFTAAGSAPIADVDGEVLWRWGDYFTPGWSEEPAGHRTIRFHHRPLDMLLTTAATCGWFLDRFEEHALPPEAVASMPGYEGQDSIPRLLGVRWHLGMS
ncbi:MAG: methyltransferase domain-containing protein [Acidimicrobiia bacterium]|nr:methyltransferase domain-containing protein [Acidimicrobiia bacterium]